MKERGDKKESYMTHALKWRISLALSEFPFKINSDCTLCFSLKLFEDTPDCIHFPMSHQWILPVLSKNFKLVTGNS